MATNKKRVLATEALAPAGRELFDARDDVETITFSHMMTGPAFQALLGEHAPVHGLVLGATKITDAELDAAAELAVIARIGVGYDAIDIPAASARKIPVMIAAEANSPSVAEQAMFMMLASDSSSSPRGSPMPCCTHWVWSACVLLPGMPASRRWQRWRWA